MERNTQGHQPNETLSLSERIWRKLERFSRKLGGLCLECAQYCDVKAKAKANAFAPENIPIKILIARQLKAEAKLAQDAQQHSNKHRRPRRSDWDSYASDWEREHGPHKTPNPVLQAGAKALKRAQEIQANEPHQGK